MSVQLFIVSQISISPSVVGTQMTVLASNAATQSYGITLRQGAEGTGPPPHYHDWDEAFYVLKGVIHFLCGGKAYDCTLALLCMFPEESCMAFATDMEVVRCSRLRGPAR